MNELSKWSLFFHSILTLHMFKPDNLSAIHVSIQQDNVLIMQCPKKTTINITAIYVENRQINCYCNGHGQCNLTLEESEYVRDTCNGNVSCGIDMKTMSIHDCLLEHGFYNLSNSCKPEECKLTQRGSEYRGIINTTRSNISCQRWDSQTPHKHSSNSVAKDDVNFCRNPDNTEGPWCYTNDPNQRWGYCNVPFCDGAQYIVLECKLTTKGTEYNGDINKTRNNIACQRWDSVTPHNHSLTKSMKKEENFCRNPDNTDGGPWCFTTDPTIRWEYCNVSWCDFPHHVQTCIDVGNTMHMEKYPTVYRFYNDFQLFIDRQLSDVCSGNYSTAQAIVIDLCNKTNDRDICSVSISRLLQDRKEIFEMNRLKVKYSCQTEISTIMTRSNQKSASFQVIIVSTLVFIIVAALMIIVIVCHRKERAKNSKHCQIRQNATASERIDSSDHNVMNYNEMTDIGILKINENINKTQTTQRQAQNIKTSIEKEDTICNKYESLSTSQNSVEHIYESDSIHTNQYESLTKQKELDKHTYKSTEHALSQHTKTSIEQEDTICNNYESLSNNRNAVEHIYESDSIHTNQYESLTKQRELDKHTYESTEYASPVSMEQELSQYQSLTNPQESDKHVYTSTASPQ